MAKKTKKKLAKPPTQRVVELPTYKSFRMSKRIKHPTPRIKSAWLLFKLSVKHLVKYRKIFLGIALVYLLLQLVFVRGFSQSTDIPLIKDTLDEVFTDTAGRLLTGVSILGVLVTSNSSGGGETANLYQSLVIILSMLATVWALRQTYAGHIITIKDTFYKGMYPLVPFILVLVTIGLQLLPFVIGLTVINIVFSNGLAVTGAEQFIWWLMLGASALLSAYMITSSVFALFIVTLADMTPLKALRSARQLVLHRRWMVLRRLAVLPVLLLVIVAGVLLPAIYTVPHIAEWIFFVLSALLLPLAVSYVYTVYRELL